MPGFGSLTNRSDTSALIPEEVAREILQDSEKTSYVLRLARRLPDMTTRQRRMPVLSALPAAYFVGGDTGLKQTTEMAWRNKYLTAEEIAVIMPLPLAVFDDADYDIWQQARPQIMTAFSKIIDQTILYGTESGANGYTKPTNDWPDGIIAGAPASHQISLAAHTDLYDALLAEGGVWNRVEEDGYAVTGALSSIALRAKMRALRDANGQPIFNRNPQEGMGYELDGVPMEFPINGAFDPALGTLVAGDFQQVVYALRQDITVTFADQAVINDAAGNIVYNLFQQDMFAARVVFRMAWQLPNPPSWLKPDYDDATRYPFAVLEA